MNKIETQTISLDKSVGIDTEGNLLTLYDIYNIGEDITEAYDKKELFQAISKAISLLSEIEKRIISLFFGFGCQPIKKDEIARKLGISPLYVDRTEKEAIKKIRQYLKEKGFYKRNATSRINDVKKMSSLNKCRYFVKKILEEGFSIEKLSLSCNMSSNSIKNCILKNLEFIGASLRERIIPYLIEQNEKERQLKLEKKNSHKEKIAKELSEIIKEYSNNFSNSEKQTVLQKKAKYQVQSLESCRFDKKADQIKILINTMSDPILQISLLLRLGYIKNQIYTEAEIAEFLNISEIEIHNIIKKGLQFISDETGEKITVAKKGEELSKNLVNFEFLSDLGNSEKIVKCQSLASYRFEKKANQIKVLISTMSDPVLQVALLLRLGYVKNQIYTEAEIAEFLNLSEIEIHNTIKTGLQFISDEIGEKITMVKKSEDIYNKTNLN